MHPQRSWRQWLRPFLRFALRALLLYLALVAALVFAYRFVDPPVSAMMLLRAAQGESIERQWLPLSEISPHLLRAAILSEDGRFCSHWGIDWRETGAAVEDALEGGRLRGASTITMQTMKNLFLWPGRDPLRKVLEMPLAFGAGLVWSKRRTLEIYLNIAEWAPGIFGAEAAARHHFGKPAGQLNAGEAALLAAMLPNPLGKRAGKLGPSLRRRAALVQRKMQLSGWAADCVARPWVGERKPQPPAATGATRPKAPAAPATPQAEPRRRKEPSSTPSQSAPPDWQPW